MNTSPTTERPSPAEPDVAPPAHHRLTWAKRTVIAAWLLLPVAVLAYHVGAGDPHIARDEAGILLREADELIAAKKHLDAASKISQARAMLPDVDAMRRQELRISEAKLRIEGGEIVEAQSMLTSMLLEAESATSTAGNTSGQGIPATGAAASTSSATSTSTPIPAAGPSRSPAKNSAPGFSPSMVNDIREQLARSSYFVAWAMRSEGASEEDWRPESDIARQQYRHLAEVVKGEREDDYKMDLEAVVRFQRMTNDELSQCNKPGACKNGKNISKKKGKQKYSKGKGPGQEADVREKIKTDSAGDKLNRGKGS